MCVPMYYVVYVVSLYQMVNDIYIVCYVGAAKMSRYVDVKPCLNLSTINILCYIYIHLLIIQLLIL